MEKLVVHEMMVSFSYRKMQRKRRTNEMSHEMVSCTDLEVVVSDHAWLMIWVKLAIFPCHLLVGEMVKDLNRDACGFQDTLNAGTLEDSD